MKAYVISLLALAAVSSARPKASGGGGGEIDRHDQWQGSHSLAWQDQEYYQKAKHTRSASSAKSHGGGGHIGKPTTTAFPTLSSLGGGYDGPGTAGYAGAGTGGYQPPVPTSSTVRSYQDTEYSEKSGQSPGKPNLGSSGSPSLGSGPSGVTGSGPVSTGTTSTGNATSGGTLSKGEITLPAGCESVNGIGFGWLPDYNGASLKVDESAVGNKNPCFAGYYGQTGLSGWNDGAQITDNIADAQSGGKPVRYPFGASDFLSAPRFAP